MSGIDILRETSVVRSPRVIQLSGMFDIPHCDKLFYKTTVNLSLNEKTWNIGLIVGPSGSGKTTIINELFNGYIFNNFEWDKYSSVLDGFPKELGIKNIVELLSSVGFSSPPSWMKPFNVLSNGEKFRVNIARILAESKELCVVDEFTSVVDRTVAKIGSHAIAKTVRKMGKKLIASSCHYDIEDWLQPDWIYKTSENDFQWRLLWQRPAITLEIVKVHYKAWEIFKQHHYLTSALNKASQCFVAYWEDIPVAFFSYLHFVNNRLKKTKRGHRLVCLPDYQGVGIGLRLEEYIASCLKSLGFDYIGGSAHPARNAYCAKSRKWKMIARPNISRNKGNTAKIAFYKKGFGRMVTTFRYVGEAAPLETADRLVNA